MTNPFEADFFTPEIMFSEIPAVEANEPYRPQPSAPPWLPAFRRAAVGFVAATAVFLGSVQALISEPVVVPRAVGGAYTRAAETGEPDRIYNAPSDMDGLARLLLFKTKPAERLDDLI